MVVGRALNSPIPQGVSRLVNTCMNILVNLDVGHTKVLGTRGKRMHPSRFTQQVVLYEVLECTWARTKGILSYMSLFLFYLKEDKTAALRLPVADGERAQIQPNFREDSCHHTLSVERSAAASRPCSHVSELAAHHLVVNLPIANLFIDIVPSTSDHTAPCSATLILYCK